MISPCKSSINKYFQVDTFNKLSETSKNGGLKLISGILKTKTFFVMKVFDKMMKFRHFVTKKRDEFVLTKNEKERYGANTPDPRLQLHDQELTKEFRSYLFI